MSEAKKASAALQAWSGAKRSIFQAILKKVSRRERARPQGSRASGTERCPKGISASDCAAILSEAQPKSGPMIKTRGAFHLLVGLFNSGGLFFGQQLCKHRMLFRIGRSPRLRGDSILKFKLKIGAREAKKSVAKRSAAPKERFAANFTSKKAFIFRFQDKMESPQGSTPFNS